MAFTSKNCRKLLIKILLIFVIQDKTLKICKLNYFLFLSSTDKDRELYTNKRNTLLVKNIPKYF